MRAKIHGGVAMKRPTKKAFYEYMSKRFSLKYKSNYDS